MQTRGRMAPVACWLTAMVTLYRDDLLILLQERDALLARQCETPKQRQIFFNNRQVHILCSQPISLQSKVQNLL